MLVGVVTMFLVMLRMMFDGCNISVVMMFLVVVRRMVLVVCFFFELLAEWVNRGGCSSGVSYSGRRCGYEGGRHPQFI